MKVGFIGLGSMASAIATGMVKSGLVKGEDIYYSTSTTPVGGHKVGNELGCIHLKSNVEVVEKSDVVIVATKPKTFPQVLSEIRSAVAEHGPIIVSVAGGFTIADMLEYLGPQAAVVRTMPNVAAEVGESITALCSGGATTPAQFETVVEIFDAVGQIIVLPESSFNAFTPIAGCSPAWVFAFIEALARGALAEGLSKKDALAIATQAVKGSAILMDKALWDGKLPGEMIDSVTSPGGSTIAGLLAGEEAGFSPAVVKMVQAAMHRDTKPAGK